MASNEYRIDNAKKVIYADLLKVSDKAKKEMKQLKEFGYEIVHREKKPKSTAPKGAATQKFLASIKDEKQKEIAEKICAMSPSDGGGLMVAKAWFADGAQMEDGTPLYKVKNTSKKKMAGDITYINLPK